MTWKGGKSKDDASRAKSFQKGALFVKLLRNNRFRNADLGKIVRAFFSVFFREYGDELPCDFHEKGTGIKHGAIQTKEVPERRKEYPLSFGADFANLGAFLRKWREAKGTSTCSTSNLFSLVNKELKLGLTKERYPRVARAEISVSVHSLQFYLHVGKSYSEKTLPKRTSRFPILENKKKKFESDRHARDAKI
ncbi:hypothetical protein TNCV_4234621 [Trichonephila clavipes]|nr:hypothetical protein TNCV_4234621 [Trichonephila clavipes]